MAGKPAGQKRLPFVTRAAWIRLAVFFALLGGLAFWGWFTMMRMPGSSYRGDLPPLSAESLRRDVEKLAGEIGSRNVPNHENLRRAADFIEGEFSNAGYAVRRQEFEVGGKKCHNLDVEIRGGARPEEIVIAGAHYDSVDLGYGESPGANDNATGVAAVLALARIFSGKKTARTLRFAAFTNEEPPYFQTEDMGSLVYARRCKAGGEKVVAMLSLETIGYYADEKGSQKYPPPFSLFYPSTGNFIAFVGNVSSGALVRQALESFRKHARFPSEGAAVFDFIPGVGWSDHWAFWQAGYPAMMVTDTAPFRYPHYHTPEDTPDKVQYEKMAAVVEGLEKVLEELGNPRGQ